jgi:hypothetical protein
MAGNEVRVGGGGEPRLQHHEQYRT